MSVSVLLCFNITINWFALSRRELNSDFYIFQEPPVWSICANKVLGTSPSTVGELHPVEMLGIVLSC